jgi:transposase-like protein
MTRAERRTHWRTLIENQATSGISIAAFCRGNHISRDLFYAWRRRFREQQPCTGGFLELISGRATEAASGIRIHPGAKLIIEVERGFDPFTLRTVVETLRGFPQCSA